MAIAAVGVVVLTALVYWPGLGGPFVLDDRQNVINVYLENLDWAGFVFTISHNTSGMLGRVVSIASFMVTGLVYGLEPWGYKFHNLLLHILTGALLARLSFLTLRALVPAGDRNQSLLASALVAAFWLLHPLLVSTVLYVVQRMTMLAAFFTVAGLLCYLALRRMQASPRYYWLAFGAYPLLQLLAVFSKEIGALLPVYILLYEALVFRSVTKPTSVSRHHQWFLAVFVVVPIAVGGLYLVTHLAALADYSGRNFTLAQRLLTQLHVVPTYLRMMLLPRVRDMSLYHDDVAVVSGFDPVTGVLLLLVLLLLGSIWFLRNRAPVIAFGLGWFFISQLMESTVFPLEMMFEHRNYLALAGILLPVMYYVTAWPERKLAMAVTTAFLLVLSLQTFSRATEWSSEEVFFSQGVNDHPGSVRVRTGLANLLTAKGNFEEATKQLEAAVEFEPREAGSMLHAVTIYCARGERRDTLIEQAQQVLGRYPASVYAMNALEYLFGVVARGQCTLVTPEDLARFVTAAQSQSGNQSNQNTRGYLLRLQGLHSFLLGQYANGVIYFRMAYDDTHDISNLVELVTRQIAYQRLQDAEDTLSVIRQINEEHRGIEQYAILRLEKLMQDARVAQQKGEQPPASVGPDQATAPMTVPSF
jgi:tetratricopeptide (TPR) repeat protein